MRIAYDDALPIAGRRAEIAEAVREHQVVVVAGETGSGKTTQLPKILVELGRESIAHTQPRRIAARSVAQRIAEECDVELGAEVGYAVRFDDRSTADTTIRLVTDGLLLSEIHHDRDLRRYDTIVVDEAHERSMSIDFLLGYLKDLLPRRPDLKVVITSATIDVERFAELFDRAPVLEVSGRTYPVEIRYRPLDDTDLLDGISAAIDELPRSADAAGGGGDVLVFLPGERDIRDAADHLAGRNLPRTEILPLFGRLSAADQHKVFSSHPGRLIVLATNVAETSLTVPGIRYVVDPGLARISRYSQRLKVQRLPIEPISQASAAQRAGRCGRVADGICIRLYAEDDFDARPEFTDPEILRTNLASVLLQMAALDLGPMTDFGFLDPPDRRAIRDGEQLLLELGAVTGDTRLTQLGRRMSQLPTDPRLARMLLAADRLGCLADVLVIVAAMSIQDPRERPLEHQQAADEQHRRFDTGGSDFLAWLALWTYVREQRAERSSGAFRRMCRDEFLHFLRIREWHDVHAQLRRTCRDLGMKPGQPGADPDHVHQAILTGLLSQVGLREGAGDGKKGREFAGARGARFVIWPGSSLARKPPQWVMAAELVETSRLFARTVAAIEPAWVEQAAGHLVKREHSEPHWSRRRGAAMAKERVTLYGLPLVAGRLVPLGRLDAPLARELFIRHALVQGEWRTHHAFWRHNQALLDDVADDEARLRRRDLRVDDDVLAEFYDARVPADVVSVRHFDAWWKRARRETPQLLDLTPEVLAHDEASEAQFPSVWRSESPEFSAEYNLTYRFEPGADDDGLTITLPVTDVMTVDGDAFAAGVPGQRRELVEALIRSLPKHLRRDFVPAPQSAESLVAAIDLAQPFVPELLRQMRLLTGAIVSPEDLDLSALPDHLRPTFRVVDGDTELARGKDLEAVRSAVAPQVEADLRRTAADLERTGLTTWDVGALDASITVGQATGFPALVDEGTSVALRVLDDPVERDVAMVRGQARLLSFALPSPVPQIGRGLDLRAKLLLSTGPDADAAAVIDQCFLAALDALVLRHGPATDADAFARLRDTVRADTYGLTEQAVRSVQQTLAALGDVQPDDSAVGEDVRVQLSWLMHADFIRDAGVERLRRLPVYLQAAARLLAAGGHTALADVQDLDTEFHRRTAQLSALRRLAPDVQEVRWAMEELRVSLFAQHLRADRPISVKRAWALVEALDTP